MTAPVLISVVPAAAPLAELLRLAIDAEQVGAGRILLGEALNIKTVREALQMHTGLLISTPDDPGPWPDVTVPDGEPLDVVRTVTTLIGSHDGAVSIGGPLPALFAALAAGGHLLVQPPRPADAPHTHAALVARAAGLARIAGRPAISGEQAKTLRLPREWIP